MKKIDRKRFLKAGGLALAGAYLLPGCSNEESKTSQGPYIQSNKTYRWRMQTTWPPNFPVLGEGCNLMAEWIKTMSGGRMEIEVFGSQELVNGLQGFEAVSNGAVEMVNGVSYYWAGKIPAAQFFSAVPFGMNAQQMNAWLLGGGGLELWQEIYAPYNIVNFPAGNTGVQMGGWFNKEIQSYEDIKGLKMRIPGFGGKVFAHAGGLALLVSGGEIYTNLERGVIDATEWIGPYHDYLMGFHQIAKYYYYPGWHEPGTTMECMINKEKYEALPKDLQEIIKSAIHRQNLWTLSVFEAKNNEYLQKILTESDVELKGFPEEVVRRLRVASKEVMDDFISKDATSRKIYDAFEKFRAGISGWAAVSEKEFYGKLQV